ncbi:MAG: M48 family metallopeptidase [Bacteroidetes bacterium]|nr:M48 family metallopeptidase [Bacteroidota bacterium]
MNPIIRIPLLLIGSWLAGLTLTGTDTVLAPVYPQKGTDPTILSVSEAIYREFKNTHTVLEAGQYTEVETVNRVSTELIRAINTRYGRTKASKELEGFSWEVHLFQEKKVDAWCLPGGKIAVYDALVRVTQSDGSLAAVLAHEMAHVLLKHGDARMKQILKEFLGGRSLQTALSAKPAETRDFFRMAYGNGDYVGVIRGFSGEDEKAADQLGVVLCAMAGYQPGEALVFWQRMRYLQGTGRQPELLSTHPLDEERMAQLRRVIGEMPGN